MSRSFAVSTVSEKMPKIRRQWSGWEPRHGRYSREVGVERCGKQPRYKISRQHCSIICSIESLSGRFLPINSVNLLTGDDAEPEVPEGQWFKRFPEMIVCGEGELVKTILRSGQLPEGEEVG